MANNSNTNDLTKGFEIYLHEKDQFWPGMEMEHIGQTKSLYIPTKTEVWGSFTAVRKINIAKKSAPCVKDPGYSYTRCMLTHLATTAGCHLDWVTPAAGQPPCLIGPGAQLQQCSGHCQVSSLIIIPYSSLNV